MCCILEKQTQQLPPWPFYFVIKQRGGELPRPPFLHHPSPVNVIDYQITKLSLNNPYLPNVINIRSSCRVFRARRSQTAGSLTGMAVLVTVMVTVTFSTSGV